MKSKILVINDDPDALELVSFVLSQSGYEVLKADGGKLGVEVAIQEVPDLIISDVRMPDLDGFEVCRLLRKDPRLKTTPFILITAASKDTESAVKGLKVGADDYVEAPFDSNRLAAKVARWIERKKFEIERKESEAKLRESQEMLRLAMSGSKMGVWSRDLIKDDVEWSEELEAIFGLPAGSFLRSLDAFYDHIYPEDRMRVRQSALSAIEEHKNFTIEFRFYHSDGSLRWMEGRGMAVYDADNIPTKVYGIGIDITERKQAEESLRRSEESLAHAQQIAHLGSWDWNIQNNQLLWSEEIYRIFGLTHSEFKGTYEAFFEVVHPDDRELVQLTVEATLTQNVHYNFEHRIIRPDGEVRTVHEIGEVIFDESGAPVRFTGIVQDITERKAAETEMRLMKSAIDSIAEGIIITDAQNPDNPMIYTNTAFENLTGYSFEEIKGQNCRFLQGAETQPRAVDKIREAIKQETTFRGKILNYRKDGASFWNELTISPIFDQSGRLTNFVGVQQDITERIQAEQSLRMSQNHLTLAQEVGKMGSFEWDFESNKFVISEELDVLYGVNIGDLEGGFDTWINFVHPEDRKTVEQDMEKLLLSGSLLNEYRIITPTGETRWLSAITKVFYDEQGKPERIVGVNKNITERKQSELRLLDSEKRFRAIFDNAAIGIALVNLDGKVFLSNKALRQMLGYTKEEILSIPISEITHPEDFEKDLELAEELFKGTRDYYQLEKRYIKKNGDVMWGYLTASAVSNTKGEILFGIGMIEDVTKRKQLEHQLLQAQKLESVGRLAGGIAHDFNNMLTAINGYSDLTMRKLDMDNPLRRNIEEIKKAGERSASLTHQLLAFSRQQILQPKIFDLNETIHDTTKMLRRLIGEDIELQLVLNPKIRRIKADPGQLTQVIMNLVVNARDAMPKGGKITLQTDDIYLNEEFVRRRYPIKAGNYVMLSVSDNGIGMDEEIKGKIFEPFFTTKGPGEGTGLGLATVYGIVKQSGGYIWVDSQIGNGTTFLTYFPPVIEEAKPEETSLVVNASHSGVETILLVEDEPMVRNLTRQILEECGYSVIEANGGQEALEICEQSDCRIDLLMTDIVMPGMSGRELAEKLVPLLPQLKVLFTSGYTNDAIIKHGVSETKQNFIQKPFTFDELSKKVREIIDDVNL